MLHDHKFTHLRYESFFGLFPARIRAELLNNCETRVCTSGSTIFKQGEEGNWMAAILAGRVRITMRSPEGKDMLLSMFERGEIFGERAVLDGMPRGADASAEGETTFLILPKEKIVPLLFQYPEAMFCIVQILCNRLSRYTETMQLLAFSDLTTRLASFILSLIPTYGKETEGKIVISSGHNQSDFAKKLGSTRESVNRQMKAFVAQGLIEVHGDEITILDIVSLEGICAQSIEDK